LPALPQWWMRLLTSSAAISARCRIISPLAAGEYSLSVKWLELLKQVAPRVTRVAVLRDSLTPVGIGQLAAIQGVAPSFGVELTPIVVRDAGEIEPAVAAFARSPDDGLIVTIGTLTDAHRDVIGKLAARLRLPAVYPFPFFVRSGGLISYGTDIIDSYRRAAGYVDRILKGEKPSDLPVQQPTKIQLAINLKAALSIRGSMQAPDRPALSTHVEHAEIRSHSIHPHLQSTLPAPKTIGTVVVAAFAACTEAVPPIAAITFT
jgi:hypothetical protein